jgi:hypothetical protein
MSPRNKLRSAGAAIALAVLALLLLAGPVAAYPVAPYRNTGLLYLPDDASGCLLSVNRNGKVAVVVQREEILAATGAESVLFAADGIASDARGAIFLTELVSRSLLRYDRGRLEVFISREAFVEAAGPETRPGGLVVGGDGSLYVVDSGRNAVLRVNRHRRTVSTHTPAEALASLGLPGPLSGTLVAERSGELYALTEGMPRSLVRIGGDGEPVVVTQSFPAEKVPLLAARNPEGALVVCDPRLRLLCTVSRSGETDNLAPALTSVSATPRAWATSLAYDAEGNLFVADAQSNGILRIDSDGTSAPWLTAEAIRAETGSKPSLRFGMTFAPDRGGMGAMAAGLPLLGLPASTGAVPVVVPAVPFEDQGGGDDETLPSPVPEPYTVLLFGGALVGLALFEATRRARMPG